MCVLSGWSVKVRRVWSPRSWASRTYWVPPSTEQKAFPSWALKPWAPHLGRRIPAQLLSENIFVSVALKPVTWLGDSAVELELDPILFFLRSSAQPWKRRGKAWFLQGQDEGYPKRNLSLYFTVLGLFRGADTGTFGLTGPGGFFFSGTVTVKESSGCSSCLNLGRKWVETCWGLTLGLQPRLAFPLLLRATYHSRPAGSVLWIAEA